MKRKSVALQHRSALFTSKSHIAHETANCRDPPIKKIYTQLEPPSRPTITLKFLGKWKDKQFCCGQNLLTEGVFVTQLSSTARISVWRGVWVTINVMSWTVCRCALCLMVSSWHLKSTLGLITFIWRAWLDPRKAVLYSKCKSYYILLNLSLVKSILNPTTAFISDASLTNPGNS